ncbi:MULTISPECIES: 5-formyltetrahydrofolate cyclo-ligase [Streptococcus]|uniref:5-formyltetrahydrofolate cyclo-ligase n=1 Tax=Streptococcus oralis subsp. tigurinus 2426 TaxID=1333865 RepID=S9SE60_STROR|nr:MULTISPECIES: 5-formyltetrahydrofolate cyclo-ligase [Streptococcus]EIC78160.1 5-formyltetrahydrofolate cyclo-ligase [Streptococcus oralis SK100]EMG33896.1 5-formyltetrahydrofolate cyclo-ligase [Streptococcus oralis subsp. tigurinus 1366]EPX88097.1 5-formyltetrahydrofolate cyclo-ligase [Streptococcus oralis subsp. tigurinus 2425]EPX88420.1 5-formyltetrahydrofolate cyclo-ligase [Streptococcus oralis subsp. tigurinus 2426]KZX07203.1 5-formyltetrahydrofolate cyclo-ligase [Streptococcus oralis]
MKAELRKKILQEMKALSQEQKQAMDRVLTERFLQHPFYQEVKTIATYLSFPHEFQTQELIKRMLKDGKKVLIPKTYPKGRMEFVVYDPKQLAKTSFGLLEPQGDLEVVEPSQIDLIHVPGLAFTREGYRIGYGGGYYDRYLEHFAGHTMSTIYPCQVQEFNSENHDIPVQEVLTYEGNL